MTPAQIGFCFGAIDLGWPEAAGPSPNPQSAMGLALALFRANGTSHPPWPAATTKKHRKENGRKEDGENQRRSALSGFISFSPIFLSVIRHQSSASRCLAAGNSEKRQSTERRPTTDSADYMVQAPDSGVNIKREKNVHVAYSINPFPAGSNRRWTEHVGQPPPADNRNAVQRCHPREGGGRETKEAERKEEQARAPDRMNVDMSLRGAQRRSNLNPAGGRLLRGAANARHLVFLTSFPARQAVSRPTYKNQGSHRLPSPASGYALGRNQRRVGCPFAFDRRYGV